jgi:transposase-like protein
MLGNEWAGTAVVNTEFSEAWCYEMLRRVRWPDGITCPFCRRGRVTTHSKPTKTPRRRYLCLACRRTFTDLTGTPMARTNLPLRKWLLCIRLLQHGRTTTDLARALEVKWDTAVQLQRRLGVALARPGLIRQLRETVEKGERG